MELVQKELEYWLASTQKLGPVKTKALLDFFGSEEAIYGATKSQLQQVEGITEAVVTEMLQKKEPACLHNNYKKMEEKDLLPLKKIKKEEQVVCECENLLTTMMDRDEKDNLSCAIVLFQKERRFLGIKC